MVVSINNTIVFVVFTVRLCLSTRLYKCTGLDADVSVSLQRTILWASNLMAGFLTQS